MSESDKRRIRTLSAEGESYGVIAGLFGVSKAAVFYIVNGRAPIGEHGTVRGYRRHLQEQTTPCDECLDARRVKDSQERVRAAQGRWGSAGARAQRRVEHGGMCDLCGYMFKAHGLRVDADPHTDTVRGTLCRSCKGTLDKLIDKAGSMVELHDYLRETYLRLKREERRERAS